MTEETGIQSPGIEQRNPGHRKSREHGRGWGTGSNGQEKQYARQGMGLEKRVTDRRQGEKTREMSATDM